MSSNSFLNQYYKKDIPDDIYRKINKDQQVNRHFRSDNVGKCALIFDEFFKTTPRINQRHWEKYYFSQRSKEPLVKASEFIAEKYGIDLQIAKQYVFYRVIGQTWNGMITEINIINEMESYFRTITFMKADYEKDEQFFTDWEAFNMKGKKKLLFGIQIKPISYQKMSTPYQLKAKENHKRQAKEYTEKFGVPHFVVYYENRKVHNPQELYDKIDTMLLFQIKVNYED